jgi:hypothetical protein
MGKSLTVLKQRVEAVERMRTREVNCLRWLILKEGGVEMSRHKVHERICTKRGEVPGVSGSFRVVLVVV